MVDLSDLDYTLLLLLSELDGRGKEQWEAELVNLLAKFLQDITDVLNDVRRATLLRVEGDFLIPWAHYKMPEASLQQMRFYIGNDHSRSGERGVAGAAFDSGAIEIVRLKQTGNEWVPNHKSYIFFEPPQHHPQYGSFAAIPLLGANNAKFGVLCLDSPDRSCFDAPELTDLLTSLSDRLVATILLLQKWDLAREGADQY